MAFKRNLFLLSLWSLWRFSAASSNPLQTQVGEARDYGKKNSPESLAWWISCMLRKSMLHKTSLFCSWNSLENWMEWWRMKKVGKCVCLFVCLLCCQAGESRVPKSFASLGFSPCVCSRSVFRELSSSAMLKYSIVLLSCLCKCHHLLIVLVFFLLGEKELQLN